jgi:putative DNA primase/helicase
MTAETIAKALGGRRAGATWMARCPAHADREPSLSIKDADHGKVLVRCHAGCNQQQVIAALKSRGIWQQTDRRHGTMMRPQASAVAKDELERDDVKRAGAALRIWAATVPGKGRLVETYLPSRGIVMMIPAALRFHAGIKHPRGEFWPAMVVLVTRGAGGAPLAIHRTFLGRDGHGKAPVEPQKMMLGPCRGGAVWLGRAGDQLLVAEGIETALSAVQVTGQPAWAALSISGLRTLDLSDAVREVIVLSDGDKPGEAAALDAGLRWKREGRCVRIARPPRGYDFNDVLLGHTLRRLGDAA